MGTCLNGFFFLKFLSSYLLTRRSRNQKVTSLLFTLLDISPTIARTQNFDTENLNYAKFYRAAQC